MGGYVYLICDPANDTYKIGVTRSLKSNRLKKLQTGNPSELHIVDIFESTYPFRLEKMLHFHYIEKKILNEWYSLNSYDVTHFKETCQEEQKILNSLLDNSLFMKNIR